MIPRAPIPWRRRGGGHGAVPQPRSLSVRERALELVATHARDSLEQTLAGAAAFERFFLTTGDGTPEGTDAQDKAAWRALSVCEQEDGPIDWEEAVVRARLILGYLRPSALRIPGAGQQPPAAVP